MTAVAKRKAAYFSCTIGCPTSRRTDCVQMYIDGMSYRCVGYRYRYCYFELPKSRFVAIILIMRLHFLPRSRIKNTKIGDT